MDMHSGGSLKEPQQYIYIEAPEAEATSVFYSRFGHNPNRVSCTCCGEDYSITERDSLEEASAYNRGCKWDKGGYDITSGKPLEEYLASKDVLVIRKAEIKDEERVTDVPSEGYVWL